MPSRPPSTEFTFHLSTPPQISSYISVLYVIVLPYFVYLHAIYGVIVIGRPESITAMMLAIGNIAGSLIPYIGLAKLHLTEIMIIKIVTQFWKISLNVTLKCIELHNLL